MRDPLDVIFEAVRDHHTVIVETNDGRVYAGRPLYMGPQSVWMVIDNRDQFIKFSAIATASIVPATPEGA